MTRASRTLIVLAGIATPYLAAIGRPTYWMDDGLGVHLFIAAGNAAWWSIALAFSFGYRRPILAFLPATAGGAVAAFGYRALDLSADAQAAIGLLFIPAYAAAAVLIVGCPALGLDRLLGKPSGPA